MDSLRIGYADPPYPGCAHMYVNDRFYDGEAAEVDHAELIERLGRDYDGWVLHTHVPGWRMLEREGLLPADVRICAWTKPFAAFKRNVPVAWTWEPVIIRAARKPVVEGATVVMRDHIKCEPLPEWVECPITMKKGLTGAKPEKVCRYAFEIAGATHTTSWMTCSLGPEPCPTPGGRWCAERPLWETADA